jgi:hypothetical protein
MFYSLLPRNQRKREWRWLAAKIGLTIISILCVFAISVPLR